MTAGCDTIHDSMCGDRHKIGDPAVIDLSISENNLLARRGRVNRHGRLVWRTARTLRSEQLEPRHCLTAVIFEAHTVDDNWAITGDIQSNYVADLDADGDLDLVSTGMSATPTVAWYENIDGAGDFGSRQSVTQSEGSGASVYADDFDGDGDVDIFTGMLFGSVAWHENVDGHGTFGPEQSVMTGGVFNQARVTDIDADGDLDLFAVSPSTDEVLLFENTDGKGALGPMRQVGQGGRINLVDVDGDSDIDLLSASHKGGAVSWYENTDGQGTFGSKQIIDNDVPEAHWVDSADLDGDGDVDVVSTSYQSGTVAWYENTDGLGTFGPSQSIGVLTKATSSNSADLDGDGDLDILASSSDPYGPEGSQLVWFENTDGQGAFGPAQTITTDGDFMEICVADLDGDGDIDVIPASTSGGISWFENRTPHGVSSDEFAEARVIAEPDVEDANAIIAADLDGDSDLDSLLISSGTEEIVWYENVDGAGNYGPRRVVSDTASEVVSVQAADLDNDGYLDVISATLSDDNPQIVWYKNDGQGAFGSPRLLAKDTPRAIYPADVDNDGDVDIISGGKKNGTSGASGGTISWYENTDGAGGAWAQHVITHVGFNSQLNIADLDGDADVDIALTTNWKDTNGDMRDIKIIWCENTDGAGTFATHLVAEAEGTTGPLGFIQIGDMDDDNDPDLITRSTWKSGQHRELVWHENVDGRGNFGAEHPISGPGNPIYLRGVADMDGDGDQDVLVRQVRQFTGEGLYLAWFENGNGKGEFEPLQRLAPTPGEFVVPADLDSDKNVDLLAAGGFDVVAYMGTGAGEFGPMNLVTAKPRSVVAADLDNDGDQDALAIGPSKIFWYDNIDGAGAFGPREVLDHVHDFRQVSAVDLDQDGDLDVFASSISNMVWYENGGGGDFGPQQLIYELEDPWIQESARVADYDGDGDPDLLSAWVSEETGTLVWLENVNGVNSLAPPKEIAPRAQAWYTTADLDGDADLDSLEMGVVTIDFQWHENADGKGALGASRVISETANGQTQVIDADLDQDGDLDLLVEALLPADGGLNEPDPRIVWLENMDGAGDFGPERVIDFGTEFDYWHTLSPVDVDGDQDLDVVAFVTLEDQRSIVWYENTDGRGTFGHRIPSIFTNFKTRNLKPK